MNHHHQQQQPTTTATSRTLRIPSLTTTRPISLNTTNNTLTIIPPSFNSFNNGHSIATLIREKRRQQQQQQQQAQSTTSSPIDQNSNIPLPSSSQERRPRSRRQTRIGPLADLHMTSRFDTLTPLSLTTTTTTATTTTLTSSSSPASPSASDQTHSRHNPPSFINLFTNQCHPLEPSDPRLAEVVMTPTTEEWWAFGGIPHKSRKKTSLDNTISATSMTPTQTKNRGREDEEEDEEDEEEDEEDDQADDDSDHTGASSNDSDRSPSSFNHHHSPQLESSSSITTPDNNLQTSNHHHHPKQQQQHSSSPTPSTNRITPLNICPDITPSSTPNSPKNLISPLSSPLEFSAGLISTEAEPTLPLPTLTSVNGIINVPSSPVAETSLSHKPESHHFFPTLTAMSSYSVGSPSEPSTEPLTSTALLSSLLDKAPPSTSSRPCSLAHDGIVRKTIDPRSYSALTAHRNLDSFVIHSSAGSGAYGIVKHAQEKGADGQPVGPPLVIKYIIKQRILADCWKRHKVLGPVPIEIHVLDHIRRVNYRPSIIAMATQYMEARKSKGEKASVETIPNRADLIQLCAKETTLAPSQTQQRTGHPNICGILDYFEDSDYYYLVMPRFGDGKDLFEHIELSPDGLPTDEARRIFGQIVDGVAFLHERNIVHRDLKDENVILDRNGNAQLIDFGSAAYVREGSKFETFSGTLDFAAPEVLKGVPHGGKEIDVWALGVILFVLITGECPFWNPEEAAQGIGEGSRARTKLESHLSKKRHAKAGDDDLESRSEDDDDENGSVLDLLKHCLHLEAQARPSVEHICWHKFFLPSAGWSGPSIPSIAEPSLPPPVV
ncbi:hypothetical protein PGT21_036950 [Puccinia graminis f. sp. tritici]|uniref:Protein kinase domain-containing protein n=1 Tax=Puccinia graminis f. sp. tritici TaxID=56615 RepID=A0A5B0QD58_PUCGR|nr:hypothetical protein PGT21_036950 [Puccinia graminis f. sp. tritici]